jgi:capsular polysaccharide biosynthesis protein
MNHPSRTYSSVPFSDRIQGKWMTLFGDFLLRRFKLASKFNITSVEKESVLVSPRKGAGKRKMTNSADLIKALQDRFQEHSDISIMEMEFSSNLVHTLSALRRTRLLISPHGAGLSNLVFMRPGASVLETDSYLCFIWGDWYGQLAKVINLNFREWSENQVSGAVCNKDAHITVEIREVSDIAHELIQEEAIFRNAHYLDLMSKVYED